MLCGFKQAKCNTDHWNLDIGSGNLLGNLESIVESEKEFDRRLLTAEFIRVVVDTLIEQKEPIPPSKEKLKKILEENKIVLFKDKE